MIVTQEDIIKQVAKREDIKVSAVRNIFKTTENIIFEYLSSTTPTENMIVKPLNGLSLECNYVPEREIHTYDHIKCDPRIWTKSKVTRHYNRKLNGYFDKE